MDDEDLLRQMLLQSMQASENQETSIQTENTATTNDNTAANNDDVVEGGAREEGEISDEEGAVTPEEEPHSPEEKPKGSNINENATSTRDNNYISIDSDEEDYSKLLKNYEKKLDPESDTKDDERRGGRRGNNDDWSPRARRQYNTNSNDRRRERTPRRSDRGRRNYREGGYYDDRPQNPAPNPAINPAFLLQSLVNFIGNARPGTVPPLPPAPHMPPYPHEPYPHPAEPYGAGDMEVDPPPNAHYGAQFAPINSAQYPPPYPPPGPYYNNYDQSYNNFSNNMPPPRTPAMTPVTQPPPRPVTVVTSPQKVNPALVTAPSVTPVTEVSNQHEDEDRLVIDLGELGDDSEDSSDSDRSANDTEDWMQNISRIKQQLAEKEQRRAKNSNKPVSTANNNVPATVTATTEDKTANDKPALVEKEQPQIHALAEKEQRIQRLKDAIARKERELQSKKQATSTKDETRGENSVNESEVRVVESRDQQPISNKPEKRPRSQSDPHTSPDPVRAVKRARMMEQRTGGDRTGDHNSNTNINTVAHTTTASTSLSAVTTNTAKNSSQSRAMTLEDRARVLREKTAEEHAIISARDLRNKLSAELTGTQHDALRSRAQLSTAERNILFLEEKLRVAREEREKLLQIRKEQENKCHVIEEQMREIERDMERRLRVIAEHDHVLQANDLQLEMDQSEQTSDNTTSDTTDTMPPSNLGNTELPVTSKPSVTTPVKPTTLPNKEIEIIDVDDVSPPPSNSHSPAVPSATPLSPSEMLLRQQALAALNSPIKAERRRARRKLRQLANSGGSGTAPVIVTPVTVTPAPTPVTVTPDTGRPSDAPFMNDADQQIVTKVRALKSAVKSDAVLVQDWPSADNEYHAPVLHRTITLAGLDDHVVVDFTADIPHIPVEGEGADYGAVLHSLDSTDETHLRVSAAQLAVPYHSPLSAFSSYRLAPHFPPSMRGAVTWSNKINPHVVFCKYDLHGTCNDDECHLQHVRDVQLSGEEVVRDIASYIEDPHQSRAENEAAITALLKQVRGTILSERLASVIRLVNQQLRARDPEHRGIVFTPRHRTLTRKTVPQQAPRRDKRPVPSNSVSRDVTSEDGEDVLVVEELMDDEQPVLHLLDEHAQLRAHTAHERYFHAHLSNHEVEQLLTAQPNNVALWLQYSATQLHDHVPHSLTAPLLWDEYGHWLDATNLVREITDSSATAPQSEPSVDAALHVLSRALEHNRRSAVLWYYYLRLYIPRAPSREELIRTIDQGLTFTAELTDNSNWTLWCLYIDAHVSLQDKIGATERAVTQLSRDKSPELVPRTSALSLLLVLQSIQLQISLGYLAQARDRLRSYIYHVTADGKLSLRRVLQPRDLELAVLSYIHVLLFDHVPNLTNHVLSSDLFVITWDKARDKSAQSQLPRLFKEVLEFPELQSRDHPLLALMVNHVLHALPNLEVAELTVQEYLKVYPQQSALFSVYALVESAHDKHDTVALIHEHALVAQPRDWMLWYHRAMHSLSRGTLDAQLQCIADAVIGLAPAPLNQLKVTPTDRQSIAVVRSLFVTALQVTRDSAEHFTPFTGTLSDTAPYADNVYLWLLFALFEMVTGSDEQVQHVINQGTERLADPLHRNKLWLFYFTWRSKHVTTAEQLLPAALGFVACQVRTVHELITWHQLELARDVSASDVQHMHVPVHVEYSALNHVIASTLQHVTSAQHRMLFLEQCVAHLPHDTYLTRALTRVLWGRALYNRAKSALLSALMRDAEDGTLWLDLAHIAMLQSRVYDASHVLRSAVRVVSSSRLAATVLALLSLTHTTDLAEHVINLLVHLRARGYHMKLFEDKIFRKSAFALPRDDV